MLACQSHDTRLAVQDAAKLLPGSSDVLCRCAKSWSDACYLDFVTPERLTDADRRALNQRAVDYAKQVLSTVLLLTRPSKIWRSLLIFMLPMDSAMCSFTYIIVSVLVSVKVL